LANDIRRKGSKVQGYKVVWNKGRSISDGLLRRFAPRNDRLPN